MKSELKNAFAVPKLCFGRASRACALQNLKTSMLFNGAMVLVEIPYRLPNVHGQPN